jgi:hypothetical protein
VLVGFILIVRSGSGRYCLGDYTYSDFGTVADCCTEAGICHPATDCSAVDGTSRVVLYQGGDASTWYGSFLFYF